MSSVVKYQSIMIGLDVNMEHSAGIKGKWLNNCTPSGVYNNSQRIPGSGQCNFKQKSREKLFFF